MPCVNDLLCRSGEAVKGGEVAMSGTPGIMTTECAAYGTPLLPLPPRPPLPLRDCDDYHDNEVVAQGNMAYAESTQIGGAGDVSSGRPADAGDDASGDYEDTEGAYEILPGETS